MDEIPKLLEKYRGQEPELIRKLEKKYGVVSGISTTIGDTAGAGTGVGTGAGTGVSGFASPAPPDKSDINTPIDITKSGWNNNVFSSASPTSGVNSSPSSLFGTLGGGNTTPTPFAVPSTGPLLSKSLLSGTLGLGGTVSPFRSDIGGIGVGTGVGTGVTPSPFSQPSVGGMVSPFSLPQQPGPSGISGITSPSGLFRGNNVGLGDTGNRPPSGISVPFGGSAGGLTGGGGLFGTQGAGGLFSGTQTPPRPVSGFSSVSGVGSYFGSNPSTHTGTLTLALAIAIAIALRLTLKVTL